MHVLVCMFHAISFRFHSFCIHIRIHIHPDQAGFRCILLCALKASSYLLLPFGLANAHFIEINSVLTSSQHRSAVLAMALASCFVAAFSWFYGLKRRRRPLRRLWLLALICCGPYSPGASLWLRTWLEQLKDARSTKAASSPLLPPLDCT